MLYIGRGGEWMGKALEPGTEVVFKGFETGAPHLEYWLYDHIATGRVVERAVKAEAEGFAVVIGCFYDPGLWEARELVSIPILGVCEASLHVASMLSASGFSILIGRRKWLPKMKENARRYGLESRFTSWRVLNLSVPELREESKALEAVLREGRRAVEEDGAECIVLRCTALSAIAPDAQSGLPVPVVDPAVVGLKLAEMMASLRSRIGLSHSKMGGYEPPPREELREIYRRLFDVKP